MNCVFLLGILQRPLHAGTAAAPIPGWVALIGGVLGLWIVIGGGVIATDRLLQRL